MAQPDWMLDVGANRFEWRVFGERPEINSKFIKPLPPLAMFRGHHYLTRTFSGRRLVFWPTWKEIPVHSRVIHFPHPSVTNFKREHRVVVLA